MREERIVRGYRHRNSYTGIIALLLLIIFVLCGIIVYMASNYKKAVTANVDISSTQMVSEYTEEQKRLIEEANQWYLRLVNPDNPLPENYSVEVSEIKPKYSNYVGLKFDSRAVDALNSMCEAAEKDGVSLLVISGYRSIQKQTELFNNKVNNLVRDGYNEADAIAAAATVVARPGTSEHNLGLAVDFNTDQEWFENTKEFKWLSENAANYGFILRYPKDKYSITKITYEPWHYRYVGVEHAKEMKRLDMCLEEYIEYLKKGGSK